MTRGGPLVLASTMLGSRPLVMAVATPNPTSSLSPEVAAIIDDLKRHLDTRVETLRADIRLLIEGVASLNAKLDALNRHTPQHAV